MSIYDRIKDNILFMIIFIIFFVSEVVKEFKDFMKTKSIQRDDGDWDYARDKL